MLKNKKHLILATLLLLLFLSACSNENSISDGEKNDTTASKNTFKRPDFGQPDEDPSFMGLVKSVIGNEVTILKIERPERNGQDTKTGADTAEEGTKAPAIGTTGGRFPGAGATGARGGFNRGDSSQQAQMLEAMKKMSSGEEKIIIPVGSQMLKRDETNTEGLGMVEASLIDITKDKMIQVWLDKGSADRNIASFVMIMQ